ncbi:MAG: glycosyltransferase [Firmicutes bacterium]|nr:glycosyltransferase [Bacillota bacterium]
MINKDKKFISAVAYVHNAEGEIEQFLTILSAIFNANFENFEIICVNDSSIDKSADLIRKFSQKVFCCTISLITTGFYQGLEQSMLAGLDLAIGDFVFEFDDIFMDYPQNLIKECYEKCLQGFDIVSCGNGTTRATSRLFYAVYNHYSGTQNSLNNETFRIISRRAINRIYDMSPRPIYRKALYNNCGLEMAYLRYNSDKKHHAPLKNSYDTAISSLLLFTNIAYKTAVILTFVMMFLTVISLIYVVIVYFNGIAEPGYTTMMFLISGAFFGLFTILSMIIKYLSLILRLVFERQRYIVKSIEKLTN